MPAVIRPPWPVCRSCGQSCDGHYGTGLVIWHSCGRCRPRDGAGSGVLRLQSLDGIGIVSGGMQAEAVPL